MKTLILLSFLLFLQFYAESQTFDRYGKRVYVNIMLNPQFSYTQLDGTSGMIVSLHSDLVFNGRFFVGGGYGREINPGSERVFPELTARFGSTLNYGLYKSKAGRYRELSFYSMYGLQFGGGRSFLTSGGEKTGSYDYYYILHPYFTISQPIGAHFDVDLGVSYKLVFSMNNSSLFGTSSPINGFYFNAGFRFKILQPKFY